MALLSALESEIAIPVCAVIGIAFSVALWCLRGRNDGIAFSVALWCLRGRNDKGQTPTPAEKGVQANCDDISNFIYRGVKLFLCKEYQYVAAFVGAFAILIFLCLGSVEKFSTQSRPCKFDPSNTCKPALATAVFSTVSFLLGAFTSVVSGFLGMKIAIYANERTVYEERKFVQRTSIAASRSGAVMGFLLASIGLLVLYLAIYLFKLYYGNDWEGLFEAITGYGLGGSFMALFGRAGGGIYAKAADVCSHRVKEIMPNIPEDDRNPAVIPNYVGDILGDIGGMGPDLFATYAESSCAALVVASISSFGIDHDFTAMSYPLLISSMGILVCLITTLMGEIMPGLETQLIISTILMTGGIFFVSWAALPSSFTVYNFGSQKVVKYWQLSLCGGVGLWAGLIIGFVNEIYTNETLSCLGEITGNSVSVSLGSVSIPFFAAVSILVSSSFAGTYGIAVAALGMLSNIATRLAIYAYGPISYNTRNTANVAGGEVDAAGGKDDGPISYNTRNTTNVAGGKDDAAAGTYGIAVAALGMLRNIAARLAIDAYCPISYNTRNTTNMDGGKDDADGGKDDAAGNTNAATGKGFPIESAALVSVALFGAFVSRPAMSSSNDVLTPKIIVGLIMGSWLPCCFSAMTMKSAGRAIVKLGPEIHEKLKPGLDHLPVEKKDIYYDPLFKISTDASVKGVILPGAIVILAPLVVGTIFGVEMLSGVLAGSLSSVVQIAILASNTDEAWKKANEKIRAAALKYAKIRPHKQIGALENAKTFEGTGNSMKDNSGESVQSGETIGDSRKDTSGEIVDSWETIDESEEDTLGKTVENEEITGDLQKDTSSEIDEIVESIRFSAKDTSSPSLNILIQLMAVESLVFAPFFATHGGLLFKIL